MPYYYTKITDCLGEIPEETKPTFIIDKLSQHALEKEAMCTVDITSVLQSRVHIYLGVRVTQYHTLTDTCT